MINGESNTGIAGNLPLVNGAVPVNLVSQLAGPSRNSGGAQQRRNVEAAIMWSVAASTLTTTVTFPSQPPFLAADWAGQLDIIVRASVALTNGGTGPTGIGLCLEVMDLSGQGANSATTNTATVIPYGGVTAANTLIGCGPLIQATPTFTVVVAPTATTPYGTVQCSVSSIAAFGPGVIMRIPYGNIGCFGLIRAGLQYIGANPWTGGTIQVIAHFQA